MKNYTHLLAYMSKSTTREGSGAGDFLLVEPTALWFACCWKIIYRLQHVDISTGWQSIQHNGYRGICGFPSLRLCSLYCRKAVGL